jgi:glycosyltransferase involved in cell wall biosynthesis
MGPMIRIAHVITKLDVGGAQSHVVELARGQADAGHRVDVIAGVGGPAAQRLASTGVPVHVVDELGASHGRASQRAALKGVTAAIRGIAPDLVHGHSSNAGLAARLAARRLGLVSVYTAHGWPFQRGAAWRQRIMSFAGEFVGGHLGDAVIVLTEAERGRARRARVVPSERLWVVPNGIADVPPELRRSGPRGGDPPLMVMVARFAPPKLQHELIEALAALCDLRWRMQFVGDGPLLGDAQAVARRTGLADRIEFLGHRDDVPAVLAASDIGVLWSRYEGLPISVIEYMRAGLCCVGSDLPGMRELLGPGGAGRLADSPQGLQGVLRQLLTEPAEPGRLARLARSRYEAAYSAAAMIAATDRVYAAVTSRAPRRS